MVIVAILLVSSPLFGPKDPSIEFNISKNEKQIALQDPVTVFVIPPITNEAILPNSSIPINFSGDIISVAASPGEFEPASFVIRSNQEIDSLMVKASRLVGNNSSISPGNIDIRVVKCWYQAGSDIYDTKNKILVPELLLKNDALIKIVGKDNFLKLANGIYVNISNPKGISGIKSAPTLDQFPVKDNETLQPVDIPKDINKQFWITIKVPDNAEPGMYSGEILLVTPKGRIGGIKLKLNVLPIILLKPYLNYSIYYTGRLNNDGSLSSGDKNEGQFYVEMKDIFDHGVANPTVYYKDNIGRFLQIRREVGIINQPLFYLGLNIESSGENSVALKNAIINLKKQVATHESIRLYIYAPDELSLNNPKNRAQIKLAHQLGVSVFDAQSKENATNVADILDLAVVSLDPDIQLARKYHEYGHKIFSYGNPQGGVENPETYRRNYGLLLWQKEYDGAMDFAYQYGYNNIWNDFDSEECRDHVFAYPTICGVIDTIQWEGWREGVDDVRYLTTLLKTIKNAKTKGKNTIDSERWLSKLKNSNLTTQNFDDIRAKMIDYILFLS